MNNEVKRLYISLYTDSGTEWIDRGFRELNSEDRILLVDKGLGKPRSRQILLYIDKILKREYDTQSQILDCEELAILEDNKDLSNYLFDKIKKIINNKTTVIFIKYQPAYDILQDRIKEITPNIIFSNSFAATKKEINKIKQQKHTQNQKDTNNANRRKKRRVNASSGQPKVGVSTDQATEIGKALDIVYSESEETENAANKNVNVKTANNNSGNNANNNVGNNTNNNTDNTSEGNENVEYVETAKDIENVIFIETKETVIQEKEDVIEIAKGDVIAKLFDRLKCSINVYIRNTKEEKAKLTDKDYFDIIQTILSSSEYKEFEKNWAIVKNKVIKPGFNSESYGYIRDEAMYYNEVAETLYIKDKWR